MNKINIRVEFEPTPIRHLAIQCPNCQNWFADYDICENNIDIKDKYDLYFLECRCPKCHHFFENKNHESLNIIECGHKEVYKNVLKKKIEWIKK